MSDTVHLDSPEWGSPLPVTRVLPPDGTPTGPAVVLAPHRDGVDEFMLGCARQLAGQGCPTYLPDVFHGQWADLPARERKARLDDDRLCADLRAVAALVADDGHPAPAVAGFCMGGRIAALAATALTDYRLAISCYGGDLDRRWGRSAATGGSPLELAALGKACPVDFHSGQSDTNPAPATVQAVADALSAAGTEARVYRYDAGHAFCNALRPDHYRPAAAALVWQRITARLRSLAC